MISRTDRDDEVTGDGTNREAGVSVSRQASFAVHLNDPVRRGSLGSRSEVDLLLIMQPD